MVPEMCRAIQVQGRLEQVREPAQHREPPRRVNQHRKSSRHPAPPGNIVAVGDAFPTADVLSAGASAISGTTAGWREEFATAGAVAAAEVAATLVAGLLMVTVHGDDFIAPTVASILTVPAPIAVTCPSVLILAKAWLVVFHSVTLFP